MSSAYQLATQRMRRAPYQALAAIIVMTVTLFVGCVFFLLAVGSEAVLRYFETRPQINAFFKTDLIPTQAQVNKIQTSLQQTGLVADFKYVSKDEALALYKRLNQNDPLLLEAVTAAMLPASIEVSAHQVQSLKTLAAILKNQEGIEDVRFAEDVVNTLQIWSTAVRIIGMALVGVHVFIALTVILLIIGIKVSSRREDIHTLRLVGATRGYVARPFIVEGILYGLIGAFLAWGIAYLILLYSMGFLVTFLAEIPILPPPIWFMSAVLVGMLASGSLIGGLGGWAAVNRFFKE